MIDQDSVQSLLMFTSPVEELSLEKGWLQIGIYPYGHNLCPEEVAQLRVVFCQDVYRKGTACFYNKKDNILFFGSEDDLWQKSKKFGLCPLFLAAFIVEVGEAEIEMPTTREITIYPEAAITIPTYVEPWMIPGVLGGSPTIRLNV